MMTWNHRVWRDKHGILSIRETHYDKKGRVEAWTENPCVPTGIADEESSDIDSLRWTLEHMLKCLDRPILDEVEEENKFGDRKY